MKATATYEGDDIRIVFTGDLEEHPEGNIVRDIEVETVTILGVECSWEAMQEHEELATAVLAKADDVEFEPFDSSDADDLDD